MEIKFLNLKISNFKNIESMEIEFGETTRVFGANETGKTTVADAISWVLTGKNSLGESTFNIIPINSVGLSPTVELKLDIQGTGDGKNLMPTLKRVMKAKQARDKSFTGEYQTECYINGVKYTQRDFDKWIETEICEPEVFRLIHDVKYFTENISVKGKERPWEARRRLLSYVCGLESDYMISLNEGRFKPISEKLSEFSDASQYFSYLKSTISDSKKRLDVFDYEIMAYKKELQDITDGQEQDRESLEKNLADLKRERMELKEQNKENRNKHDAESAKLADYSLQLSRKLQEAKNNLSITQTQIGLEKQNYEKYGIACPTCGRKFARGFSEQRKADYDKKVKDIEEKAEKLKDEIKKLEADSVKAHKKYEAHLKAQPEQHGLDEIESRIWKLETALMNIKNKSALSQRLEKAEQERKNLSANLSELNKNLDLCREFLSYKCTLVESKVNNLVDGVEFVMFRENKTNDEIRECCDIKYNGVDYNDLSYSTKFFVSMLIVRGFQHHFDVKFPLLIDNAESIDLYGDYGGQMIFLCKEDESCPDCGERVGRKQSDGHWHCEKCGKVFDKKLRVYAT